MNNGYLLVCPNCEPKRTLGSIDTDGAIHIRRKVFKGEGHTTVSSVTMTVMCDCGFGTTIYQQYDYATPANA